MRTRIDSTRGKLYHGFVYHPKIFRGEIQGTSALPISSPGTERLSDRDYAARRT